ncbi:Dph6-related ATP pyrophosphatase [Pseudochryseolinea flava]|uniref:Diphthine--ammonia ligase n=1 Tax=Pseudochryseolinea flava TaxID=2059302 RepID=A0A364XZ85_9BACT|nr:diphthine--ammonia ligase [Pseudochryseolinea flava]RAV99793.1 diphthine--ammonia ligase [Pseudochryseolinea flava]
MVSRKKITISWSGGKDSAFALFKVMASGEFEIVNLHTVIDKETRRVGLHGIHETLIEQQAAQLGVPLVKLYLTASQDHDTYTALMKSFYKICASDGIEAVMYGDIFLEDLRAFRESLLAESKLEPIFPLWGIDSRMLLSDFIGAGFKTVLCAADASLFAEEDLGRFLDDEFLETLSPTIDPCGECGEFHTFVVGGPIFKSDIAIERKQVVKKTYTYAVTLPDGESEKKESAFWFQDLRLRISS